MALSDNDLRELRARCQKALSSSYGVGMADSYLADLSAELGQKASGPATTERLLALISDVEALRAGKPPEPEETEDEEEDEPEDVEEKVKTSPTAAPKPRKPVVTKKKKVSKKVSKKR